MKKLYYSHIRNIAKTIINLNNLGIENTLILKSVQYSPYHEILIFPRIKEDSFILYDIKTGRIIKPENFYTTRRIEDHFQLILINNDYLVIIYDSDSYLYTFPEGRYIKKLPFEIMTREASMFDNYFYFIQESRRMIDCLEIQVYNPYKDKLVHTNHISLTKINSILKSKKEPYSIYSFSPVSFGVNVSYYWLNLIADDYEQNDVYLFAIMNRLNERVIFLEDSSYELGLFHFPVLKPNNLMFGDYLFLKIKNCTPKDILRTTHGYIVAEWNEHVLVENGFDEENEIGPIYTIQSLAQKKVLTQFFIEINFISSGLFQGRDDYIYIQDLDTNEFYLIPTAKLIHYGLNG